MKRSVYSLVLMDEVVQAIDRMAYAQNTSRSNLINQILAEYTSCITPERRMQDIFDSLGQLIGQQESFQIQQQPSGTLLSIRSPLHYKYKPTIRYAVELYREPQQTVGQLRVSFRTQSQPLIALIHRFFAGWVQLEEGMRHGLCDAQPVHYTLQEGRMTREFLLPEQANACTDTQIGQAIAQYIQLLDGAIKLYFACDAIFEQALGQMQREYRTYLQQAILLI